MGHRIEGVALDKSSPIAVITQNQIERDLICLVLSELGYKKFTGFSSGREAYEFCIRQQFPFFITRMELPDLSGVILIQKLRESGNYGLETHLMICKQLTGPMVNVLYEYDIQYVMTGDVTRNTLKQKLLHTFARESTILPIETEYRTARAAVYTNNLDMAEDAITKILEQQPNSEKALVLRGDIYLKRAEADAALNCYRKALETNPKSAGAAHKIAAVLMMKGQYREAADMLNELSKINPLNIRLLENAGLSNFNAERLDIARTHMENLSGLDSTNTVASEVMVNIKIKRGEYSGMVDQLRKSHDEKSLVQFLNNAGVKLSQGADPQGALAMYRAAVEQLGDEHKYAHAIYYNMGVAHRRMGKMDQAIILMRKAISLKPDFEKAKAVLEDLEKSLQQNKAS